jgi:hypothetical protein
VSEVRESRGGRRSRRGEGVAWLPADEGRRREIVGRAPADGGQRRGRAGEQRRERERESEEREEGYKLYEWAPVVVVGMKEKYE